jgi:hypothetical protein
MKISTDRLPKQMIQQEKAIQSYISKLLEEDESYGHTYSYNYRHIRKEFTLQEIPFTAKKNNGKIYKRTFLYL